MPGTTKDICRSSTKQITPLSRSSSRIVLPIGIGSEVTMEAMDLLMIMPGPVSESKNHDADIVVLILI